MEDYVEISVTKKTQRVTLIMGISPGFGGEPIADEKSALERVVEEAIAFAGEKKKDFGAEFTFIATIGKACYQHDRGCPKGGESVIILSGERNPLFWKNQESYAFAWYALTAHLKKFFNQETARLVFEDVYLTYFK